MKLYTWIITAVAIIELALLFFKSALNEILVHWWKSRKERKWKEREDLREAYDCLHKMSSELTTVLFLYHVLGNVSRVEWALYFETYQKPAMVKFSKLQGSLNEIRLRLPKNIRKIVDETYGEMGQKLEETQFDSVQSLDKVKKRIEDITHKVADTMEQLLNYIDSY